MELKNNKLIHFFVLSLMITLYFGIFNFNLGFSLKLYMIITVISFIFFMQYIKFSRLIHFEIIMIIFILCYSATALQFNYPAAHLRFIFAFIVILFFYFVNRGLLEWCNIESINKMLSISGSIGCLSSLIYYLMGIISTGGTFTGNSIIYGLRIDRSLPRLIGTTSGDPNIFVYFITLYFFYTLFNLRTKLNRIGFILSFICIVLSFSRGAYLAIIVGLIISFFLINNIKKQLKIALFIIFLSVIIINISQFSHSLYVNPIDIIEQRFYAVQDDGGSGRVYLWTNALKTFTENPILGIGINGTIDYSRDHYSFAGYVHNTFLEVLSESGFIGISLYLLLWYSIFHYCIKLVKTNKDTKFLLITFIAMFIQLNSLSILYNESFYFALLILFKYTKTYLHNNKQYKNT